MKERAFICLNEISSLSYESRLDFTLLEELKELIEKDFFLTSPKLNDSKENNMAGIAWNTLMAEWRDDEEKTLF